MIATLPVAAPDDDDDARSPNPAAPSAPDRTDYAADHPDPGPDPDDSDSFGFSVVQLDDGAVNFSGRPPAAAAHAAASSLPSSKPASSDPRLLAIAESAAARDDPTAVPFSFTSQLRSSPLAASPALRAMAFKLLVLLRALPLDPWEYADLVTDIDTAVHLFTSSVDPAWPSDILSLGLSLATAASVAHSSLRIRETEQRIQDTVAFFRAIVTIGQQSRYRARKLIRALQGGWYVHGLTIEDLADRACKED
ncbi:hypothetical protein HDU82_001648, partial [Entophlyctis luteolus]